MKRRYAGLLALALVPAALAGDGARNQTTPPAPATVVAGATGTSPYAAAGMILSIDPATGKFRTETSAQTAADLQLILGDAISTSSEGLVEEKNTVPGGGYKVDLQGRFQNAMMMTVDADGNTSAPCVTGTPADAKAPGEVK